MHTHRIALLATLVPIHGVAGASLYDWTLAPSVSGVWSNPDCWNSGLWGTVPGAGDTAQIANGGTCILDQARSIDDVRVWGGSTLRIQNQLLGTGELDIGSSGAASHVHQTSALTAFSFMKIGDWWGDAGGTYTLDGGAQLEVGGLIYVGRRSPATFTQHSGSVSTPLDVYVGWGRSASYFLGGGTLSCRDLLIAEADHAGYPNSTSLFQIGDATLTAEVVTVDKRSANTGVFRIIDGDAEINITERLRIFGRWEAEAQGTVNLHGAALQLWVFDAETVAGLAGTRFACVGESEHLIELGSADLGPDLTRSPRTPNFEYGAFIVTGAGVAKLRDVIDNQGDGYANEVGYVYDLVIGPGATLDLAGRTLYALNQSIDPTGSVIDSVGGGQLLTFTAGGCNPADLAPPFGLLDLSDVTAFAQAFLANDPMADLVAPEGLLDLADVLAFVQAFTGGCP
jgi:hypothetical protein